MTAYFPDSWEHLVTLLSGSVYLTDLCNTKAEQTLKNQRVFSTAKELAEFYASGSKYVSPAEEECIRGAVGHLYACYPDLPRVNVYVVVIDPQWGLELGRTSFTLNDIIFLHESAVLNCETIMHETVHVIQRVFPKWFGWLCNELGYHQWSNDHRFFQTCQLVLNPDAEVTYADDSNRFVAYNHNLLPTLVDTTTGDCNVLDNNSTVNLLGVVVKSDSVSEMVAVRFTEAQFVDDEALRNHVNQLLSRFTE